MTLNTVNRRQFPRLSRIKSALHRLADRISTQVRRFSTATAIAVFGVGVWLDRFIESPTSLSVDRIIVISFTIAVLSLSIVSKWKRFKGSGNEWLVATAKGVEWLFWGLSGAMFDALLTIFAIADRLPVELVATVAVVILLYMGLTVRILKRAEESLSPTTFPRINPV